MKQDLTTGTWQDDTGCPISIILVSTSDEDLCSKETEGEKEEKDRENRKLRCGKW
jgi:hypothetical protein